jgi:hypothetical protein
MTLIESIDDISQIYDNGTLRLRNVSFKFNVFEKFLDLIEKKEIIIRNLEIRGAELYDSCNNYHCACQKYDLTYIVSKIIDAVGVLDYIYITNSYIDLKGNYYEFKGDRRTKVYLHRLYENRRTKFVKYIKYGSSIIKSSYIRYLTKMAIEKIDIFTPYASAHDLHELKTALAIPSDLSKKIKFQPHVSMKLKFEKIDQLSEKCQKQITKYNQFHVMRVLLNKSYKVNPLLPFPVDGGHIELFRMVCNYAVSSEYSSEYDW